MGGGQEREDVSDTKEAVCLWDLCFKRAACEHDTLNAVGRVLDGYKGMRYAILWDMMTLWLWWLPRDANVGNWPVLSFCYHCNQATKIKMSVPNIKRNYVQLSKISVYWWYKNKDKALLFQLSSDTAPVQFTHILEWIIYNLIVIARHKNITVPRSQ